MTKKAAKLTDERITPRELKEQGVKTVLDKIRGEGLLHDQHGAGPLPVGL